MGSVSAAAGGTRGPAAGRLSISHFGPSPTRFAARRPMAAGDARHPSGAGTPRSEAAAGEPDADAASKAATRDQKPRRASRDAQASTRKPLRASRDAQAAMPKPRAQAASCDCVWRAAIRSREPTAGQRPRQPASRLSSSRTEPFLESGSLPLPHLGDWMQDGQPAWHSQLRMASAVARSHSAAAW